MTSTANASESSYALLLDRVRHDEQYVTTRERFWLPLLGDLRPENVLEIGCGVGNHLQCVAQRVSMSRIIGVDVNATALRVLEERLPGVRTMYAPLTDLPFADRSVDFVVSMGALAALTDNALEKSVAEMVRVSKRWVFCAENRGCNASSAGQADLQSTYDNSVYSALFEEMFPYEMTLVRNGRFDTDPAWECDRWWMFERAQRAW